jgi:transcription-repair coupling factor (superfamily II helicase)
MRPPVIELESGSINGLHRTDAAFVFSRRFLAHPGRYLWVCRTNREAEELASDLSFLLPKSDQERVVVLPGAETDPYRGLSPHPEILEERAAGLWKLLHGFQGFALASLSSLMTRLPSVSDFLANSVRLEVGSFLPMSHLLMRLRQLGYVREDPVTAVGEYSWRGGIVDIFSPSAVYPVRVEFFGDEIESIRAFDPSTQRSTSLVPQLDVTPMREWSVTDVEISRWHEEAPRLWNEVRFAEALEEKLQFTANQELFNGFEYLFPLVVGNDFSLFDYAAQDGAEVSLIVSEPDQLAEEWEDLLSGFETSYEDHQLGGDLALPPSRLFFSPGWFDQQVTGRPVYFLNSVVAEQPGVTLDFHLERKYHGRIQDLLADLNRWLTAGEQTVFVLSSKGLAERLVDMFSEYDVGAQRCEDGFEECLRHAVSVTHGKVSEGFFSASLRFHLLTQDNVFEESELRPAARKAAQRDVAAVFVSDFRDLKVGDYVVHVDHGLGMFRGLKRIGVGENLREFVELAYRDDAKLYVPIDRLDLIQKYSGAGEAKPTLDRLGGASWEKTKARVKKSMRILAEDLLKLYAQREVAQGYAFSPDDGLGREFDEAFEFDETADQHAAIKDVKRDLEAPRPMDRLVCGDVGYGKTEVAMRAAFKVVNDGKQVAVLAPTTVLAFQHFNTFRLRFQAFPVHVEMVSRFRSRQEIKQILHDTSVGSVDVLIGTHRLLSKDVKFRDLGLLVIDEEQRFGVAQKERLKQLKTKVDVLALSATPIPRTLNMSMIGLRDLSIIETPPKDRLAIQTVVVKFSRSIIRSAIDLELKRLGQALFLHNSIDTIHSIAAMVQETVPEARVAVAHGQMKESHLEDVMLDFLNYKYDVLVSTTIIENGLDIPRANTLIVNQADRFGLAQLYQLRGRVGRSNRRAYAYLLLPSEETLTTDARKRLAAIKEFSDLGAGFRIAALDLEIRGAGNLLGGEQHGHINAIGFELYLKLLEQTIRELRGEPVVEEVETTIDLGFDIQIPEHYIPDSNLRLWLYKRVSSAPDERALESLREEVTDRFGKYPRAVANLFEYATLRLDARALKALSLDRKGDRVSIRLRDDTPVSGARLVEYMRREPRLSLSPEGIISFDIPPGASSEMFSALREILREIAMLK